MASQDAPLEKLYAASVSLQSKYKSPFSSSIRAPLNLVSIGEMAGWMSAMQELSVSAQANKIKLFKVHRTLLDGQ